MPQQDKLEWLSLVNFTI